MKFSQLIPEYILFALRFFLPPFLTFLNLVTTSTMPIKIYNVAVDFKPLSL
jgi:hypothetical protein